MKKTKFSLSDFKDGAVPGLVLMDAFRNPKLLEPVKKWIAEGKLVSPTPNADPLSDLWWTADSAAKPEPKPVPVIRSAAVTGGRRPTWPYECGQMAASGDKVHGTTTANPCIGWSGERWQAGYEGRPEPVRAEP